MKKIIFALIVIAALLAACGSESTPIIATAPAEAPAVAATDLPPAPAETTLPEPSEAPANPPAEAPEVEAAAGYKLFSASGIQIQLPETYEGGDLSTELPSISARLRALGPDYEPMAAAIEQNPGMFRLWAFDSVVGSEGFLTNANVTTEIIPAAMNMSTYLDAARGQLPSTFVVTESEVVELNGYEAGRLVMEVSLGGRLAKELLYAVKDGTTVYVLAYATGADEFEDRLESFEFSARTLTILP
jgi:hypothetical protein